MARMTAPDCADITSNRAMELEHWLSQIGSSFTTGIDLLTVSQFNKVLWILHLSTGYVAYVSKPGRCIGTVAVRPRI